MTAATKYTLAAVWFFEDRDHKSATRWAKIIQKNEWLGDLYSESVYLSTELGT